MLRKSQPSAAGNVSSVQPRRPAPLHFLHDRFIVGQLDSAEFGEVFCGHSRDEIRERRIQRGDALRETSLVAKEAPYHFAPFLLVRLHGACGMSFDAKLKNQPRLAVPPAAGT